MEREGVSEEAAAIDDAVSEVGVGSGLDVGGTGDGTVTHTVLKEGEPPRADVSTGYDAASDSQPPTTTAE